MTKTPDEQAWHEVFSEVRLRGGVQPKPPARFVNSELVYTIGVGYGEAGTALRLWLRDRDPDGPREAHSFRLLTAEVPLLPDPADRRLLGALGSSLERSSAARVERLRGNHLQQLNQRRVVGRRGVAALPPQRRQ